MTLEPVQIQVSASLSPALARDLLIRIRPLDTPWEFKIPSWHNYLHTHIQ